MFRHIVSYNIMPVDSSQIWQTSQNHVSFLVRFAFNYICILYLPHFFTFRMLAEIQAFFSWLYWCLIINAALPIIWRVKFRISRTNCLFIITDKLFCLVEDQHQRLRVIFQGCVIIDHYWLYCSYIVSYILLSFFKGELL
jgi:hypothetical protein